jgi:small subunit ribosomal protein S8
MQTTDAIADMLTRIRNANDAKHETVDIPASNIKREIAKILREEGYIRNYEIIEDGKQGIIRISLKYAANKKNIISGLKRISKPGLRVYANKDEIPKVLGGLGIAIISTSKGIMTDKSARNVGVGGEVLAFISEIFINILLLVSFSNSLRNSSIPVPPFPITNPGFAVFTLILTLFANLSISILEIPAAYNLFLICSLILTSSTSKSLKLLSLAYHFVSQSLIIPILSP